MKFEKFGKNLKTWNKQNHSKSENLIKPDVWHLCIKKSSVMLKGLVTILGTNRNEFWEFLSAFLCYRGYVSQILFLYFLETAMGLNIYWSDHAIIKYYINYTSLGLADKIKILKLSEFYSRWKIIGIKNVRQGIEQVTNLS